jgi:hypothetical protein
MDKPWKNPVSIALEGPETFVTIGTTQAASWALIEDWPTEEGTALDRALTICAEVIKGKRSAEDAHQAFVDAANEAGLSIKA